MISCKQEDGDDDDDDGDDDDDVDGDDDYEYDCKDDGSIWRDLKQQREIAHRQKPYTLLLLV